MKLSGRDAAHFILGYYAATVEQGKAMPAYLKEAVLEAKGEISGKPCLGLFHSMEDVANRLAARAAEKAGGK